jgi:hypothetical protein
MKRSVATLLAAIALHQQALAAPSTPPVLHRVVITEIMANPVGVDPAYGQWIEIMNPLDEPVNLQGMVLTAGTSKEPHVISWAKEELLQPGGRLVLGRTADTSLNGGVEIGYVYGGDILLDPEQDLVTLKSSADVVDAVSYGSELATCPLPPLAGASISLEPGDQAIPNWCYARTEYGALGNKGTPGAANTWCDDDGDGFAEDQGDCDDTLASVNPDAGEACNGIDDDCNGTIDDGLPAPPACKSEGVCAGTAAACLGHDGFVCAYPDTYEPVESACDGLDNDCDGDTDEDVKPPDGACLDAGVCAGSSWLCAGPKGWLCTYPATWEPAEATCDGLDNDCDGDTDEGFDIGGPCTRGEGACSRPGVIVCGADGEAGCTASPGKPAAETCDGVDNDCDGETDEGFVDATRKVGAVCTVGVGACAAVGKYRCADDGAALECQAVPGTPRTEVCGDGEDNDCDGVVDEADCGGAGCGGSPADGPPSAFPLAALLLACLLALRQSTARR